ncbi:MAG: amidohydrolase family protein, partial [Nanoarchaeota archaeon]
FPFLIFIAILTYGCGTQEVSDAEEVPEGSKSMEVPEVEERVIEEPGPIVEEAPEEVKEITKEVIEEPVVEPKPCGSLYDAYTRITGGPQDSGEVKESELASLLAKRMEETDVGCALLVGVDVTDFDTQQQIRDSIDYYATIINSHPGRFVPLLDIDADSASEITVDLIKQILEEAEGKIDYRGFGEVSFVDPGPWKSKKLTDKPLPEIIEFLGENDMILAAHIRNGQTIELDTTLSQHPNTKILVHGNPSGMKELLAKHKNLYYAAELEIMLGQGTFSCSISSTDSKVNSAVSQYAPIIAAAPEQVLFATNAHSKCHFQPQFYSEMIEFTDKFIEKLPEEHRDLFAYKNALALFGVPN